jgi:hypothetical protein
MPHIIDSIPINTTEIPQELLDISYKSRANNFAWNGQFSPQFIEILINTYANSNSTVFDPFLGSGTVLLESVIKNICASGIELNPSAYFMAKIYELSNIEPDQRQTIVKSIDKSVFEICQSQDLTQSITETIQNQDRQEFIDIFSLLVVLLDVDNKAIYPALIVRKWGKIRSIIINLPFTSSSISAKLGDLRNITNFNNEVDLIITSPSYVNVFNYHQNYRKSVELFGFNMLKIAKQ